MYLFISNRGNLTGTNLAFENSPEYVKQAMIRGYHVVVDVHIDKQHRLFLGELFPQYPVELVFLKTSLIIARVNDMLAFQFLKDNNVHVVFNSRDYTLTSQDLIWPYQGCRSVVKDSILNMPEFFTDDINQYAKAPCRGICSNQIETISKTINKINNIIDIDMINKPRRNSKLEDIEEEDKEMKV